MNQIPADKAYRKMGSVSIFRGWKSTRTFSLCFDSG